MRFYFKKPTDKVKKKNKWLIFLDKQRKLLIGNGLTKSFRIVATEEISPEKINLFKTISHWVRTVAYRVDGLGITPKVN